MKRVFTINRIFAYLITFIIVLGLFFTFTDFWKQLDYEYFKSVYMDDDIMESDQLLDDIRIIDLPKEGLNPIAYRKKIIALVDYINAYYKSEGHQDIAALVLDISFSREEDTVQLYRLKEALEDLKTMDDDLKVYAAYSLKAIFDNEYDMYYEENEYNQAGMLYDEVFDGGRLHTGFKIENNIITYESEIEVKRGIGKSKRIEALVTRIAKDAKGASLKDPNPQFFNYYVAPYDPDRLEIEDQKHVFNLSAIGREQVMEPKLPTKQNSSNKLFVLVGDLQGDILPGTDIPGTHALAWALNEQRLGENSLAKQPFNSLMIIIGQVFFFALFTVLVFALVFKYFKRLKTKPKVIAIVSFLVSMMLLFAYGAILLTTGKVIPIGLTLLAIAISAVLAWRFAYKFLVTGVAEGSEKYDVFISYSHSQTEWVKKHLLAPLEDLRKPNGDKLSIFFDEKSIGLGEAFTAKYMWGIVDSKFFIPVMSMDYYKKNHCRNEMDLAYKRKVEELIEILPIAFSYEAVPEIYRGHIYADLEKESEFIERLKNELTMS